jgi:hypothetical protein
VPHDWIDRIVPEGASVAMVWTGRTDRFTVNQNEFFNRSVGPVYYIGGPTPGGLPETRAVIARGGTVRTMDGAEIRPRYVVLDGTFDPDADLVRRDAGTGMTLWHLDGPLTAANLRITGLYPNDTWSGPRVVYRKEPCRRGILAVALGSDPAVFDGPTTVVARAGGRELGRTQLDPDVGRITFRVPLAPRNRVCRVVFHVSPTAVPSRVDPDSDDHRRLGAHFYGFVVER